MDPVEVDDRQVVSSEPVMPVAPGYARDGQVVAGRPVVPVEPVAPPYSYSGYRGVTTTRRASVLPVAWRETQLVWLAVGVVNVILGLDFVFRAAGANDSGFAAFIYNVGSGLASPFNGIFANTDTTRGNVVKWADVLAVVVYTLAAWGVAKLLVIMRTPRADAPLA